MVYLVLFCPSSNHQLIPSPHVEDQHSKNQLHWLPGHAGGGCEPELTSDLLLLTACRPEALQRSMLEVVLTGGGGLLWRHVIYLTVMTQRMSNRGFYKSETSQWTASRVRSIFNCALSPSHTLPAHYCFFNHDQDWKISLCCGNFTNAPSTTSAWRKGPDTHKNQDPNRTWTRPKARATQLAQFYSLYCASKQEVVY